MFSFGWPQLIVVSYMAFVLLATPLIRLISIRYTTGTGQYAFVSWKEYWGKWSADAIVKAALIGLLYWGGFWG